MLLNIVRMRTVENLKWEDVRSVAITLLSNNYLGTGEWAKKRSSTLKKKSKGVIADSMYSTKVEAVCRALKLASYAYKSPLTDLCMKPF